MITLPAHKVRQFGVEFYQTSFTSGDIQKLVKFEVELSGRRKRGKATETRQNLSHQLGITGKKDREERGRLSKADDTEEDS